MYQVKGQRGTKTYCDILYVLIQERDTALKILR